MKTCPNLPAPNFLPRAKSLILAGVSSEIYCGVGIFCLD